MGLGDLIETALSSVGVTKSLVEGWLGKPCGCDERKQKLNALSFWAQRVISGKIEWSRKYLHGIMGLDENKSPRS